MWKRDEDTCRPGCCSVLWGQGCHAAPEAATVSKEGEGVMPPWIQHYEQRKGEGSCRPGCILTKRVRVSCRPGCCITSISSSTSSSGQQERVKEGRGSLPPSINNISNSVLGGRGHPGCNNASAAAAGLSPWRIKGIVVPGR